MLSSGFGPAEVETARLLQVSGCSHFRHRATKERCSMILQAKLAAFKADFEAGNVPPAVIETMRRGFADRAAYLGDPTFSAIPTAGFLSPAYAKTVLDSIDLEAASKSERISAGNPDLAATSEPTAKMVAAQ